ncbi:hypothetical protein ACQP00_30510 [Dactylosporangium sp. CS-047395]|uniref:hypothetical protein n=1 Tax=Dactylosporangium sp. CS-047395 TaxID=3239936 RepID=UPI003D8C6B6B
MIPDLAAALADAADSAEGAWRFVRRVAPGPPLAVDVPPALRELYALLGHHPDRLLRPAQLQADGPVLVFRTEAQSVTCWGVRVAALDDPDPPVVYELPDGTWAPYLDRVSLAAVEIALTGWLFGGDETDADNCGFDAATLAALERTYERLPMPDYPTWTAPDGPPTRWFGGPDVLLRDDGQDWLWVRATTPAGIAAVRAALPGDWIMS